MQFFCQYAVSFARWFPFVLVFKWLEITRCANHVIVAHARSFVHSLGWLGRVCKFHSSVYTSLTCINITNHFIFIIKRFLPLFLFIIRDKKHTQQICIHTRPELYLSIINWPIENCMLIIIRIESNQIKSTHHITRSFTPLHSLCTCHELICCIGVMMLKTKKQLTLLTNSSQHS